MPERETSPIEPSEKISAGMMPTFAFPGESAPGAIRAEHRHALRPDVRVDAQHLVGGQTLGDADHRANAGVDRLVDRVGGETGRDEDHRRVRTRLGDGLGDRVEDGHAFDVLAALARGDARDDLGAVPLVAEPVERAF